MNENNTNLEPTNEKVKIEYVNPLNPNEILNTKQDTVNYAEIKEEQEVVEEIKPTKKKRKVNKLAIAVAVLVILVIILLSIILVPKLFDKKTSTPEDNKPVSNTPAEDKKIALENIVTNATNNTYYKFLTSSYIVNITNNEDSITVDLNNNNEENPITKQFVFNLNNRNLQISFDGNEDNYDKLNAFYALLDSIGQFYGHGIDEVGNYLYNINNNYSFDADGITTLYNEETNTYDVKINIDSNISTVNLSSMYFTLDELNNYKDNILNSYIDIKKGDLILYTNSEETIYRVLIGQRKELTSNTYNTITNIIELLYPDEINDFKSKFTTLSSISFDKYKVTIDPELDSNTYPQYKETYKFIAIEITKSE